MSDAGEIEVENSALYEVLPKDVVKEVGNVKLFNKWDYDVEVRDISLTYVLSLEKLSSKTSLVRDEMLTDLPR
jgi:small subunit ribosomal protein S5e